MWVFQTRGFSGIDAEHSILYQIRRDAPDGAAPGAPRSLLPMKLPKLTHLLIAIWAGAVGLGLWLNARGTAEVAQTEIRPSAPLEMPAR